MNEIGKVVLKWRDQGKWGFIFIHINIKYIIDLNYTYVSLIKQHGAVNIKGNA